MSDNTIELIKEKTYDFPENPVKIEHYVLENFDMGKNKSEKYILKHQEYDLYLILDKYDYFIWTLLDGTNDYGDICLKFYKEFGKLPVAYIQSKIMMFCKKGFIRNYEDLDPDKLLKKKNLFILRFPIKKIDNFFSMIYKIFGEMIFNRYFKFIALIITLLGIFIYNLKVKAPDSLLYSKTWYNVLIVYIAFIIPILLHETSHAITCIHYNCDIKEAGFMLYIVFPVLYVNTSDSWLIKKRQRIMVSLAGIISDLVIGSLFIIIYYIFPGNYFSKLFYQITMLCYVRIWLNLNPFLKWDGYYVLMDLLNTYNFKRQAYRFLTVGIKEKFLKREVLGFDDYKLLVYAIFSFVYIVYFLLLGRFQRVYFLISTMDFTCFKITDIISIFFILQVIILIIKGIFKKVLAFKQKILNR